MHILCYCSGILFALSEYTYNIWGRP